MNEGQPSRPANVLNIVAINQGKQPLSMRLPHVQPRQPEEVARMIEQGVLIVDARSPAEFGSAHIPGAINIQLASPEFEQRVGWVLPEGRDFILVLADEHLARRAVHNLAFIGLERRVAGFLDGCMEAWLDAGLPYRSVPQITVRQLYERLQHNNLKVLDVRERSEWEEGHIAGAQQMSYKQLRTGLESLDLSPQDQVAVICAGGYRSSTATGILLQHGFENVLNVTGGMTAWRAAKLPMLDGQGNVCAI